MIKPLYNFFAALAAISMILAVNIDVCVAESTVIAEVNGEVITEEDLQERISDIHMYKPRLPAEGEASGVSIDDIIEDLVNERLVVQEAYRLGLDQDPDVVRGVRNFLEIRSVYRMEREEILDKIEVTEEEISGRFNSTYSVDEKEREAHYEMLKGRIARDIREEKEAGLKREFLDNLRQQAAIEIDWALIEQLEPGEPYLGDKQQVGAVNGEPIPLAEFISDLEAAANSKPAHWQKQEQEEKSPEELKKDVVNRLVDYELIRQEALRRNYLSDENFAKMVEKRKQVLLIDKFKGKMIYPLSRPTEEEMRQYYREHPDKFKANYEVWFSEMAFKDVKNAESALAELQQGADFEYLATQVSPRRKARKYVWVNSGNLPREVKAALDEMREGEISDVIQRGRDYMILKLKGKRGGEVLEYSKVADAIEGMVREEKFQNIIAEYIQRLRDRADIDIHSRAVERIEKKYWQ